MKIIVERKNIGHNTFTVMEPEEKQAGRIPTVFCFHGLRGKGVENIRIGRTLAKAGMRTVLLTSQWHGETQPDNMEDLLAENNFVPAAAHMIQENIWELQRLIDVMESKDETMRPPYGALGFSMGGFLTWMLPLYLPEFRVLCPIAASPRIYQGASSVPHDSDSDLTGLPQLREAAQEAPVYAERYTLVLHNMDDDVIDPAEAISFSQEVVEYIREYGSSGEMVLRADESDGHAFDYKWDADITDFFLRHL